MAATWSTQSATREYQMAANGELTVVERMASLLETGQFADVTIRCGSGNGSATFKAHRLLLATASPSLQKLMAASNSSGDGSTLHFKDVEPDAFQHLLKYIYTDDVQIDGVNEGFSLLRMSKNWCLNKLTERTLKYLDSFLETYEPSSEEKKNELCDLIILTEGYVEELNKKSWDTLIQNVNKVVPCQGFLNMTQDHLKKLLSHEDFNYTNQLVLFEAIRDWGMNQVLLRHLKVNQLQEVIGSLMEFVNFKSIKDGDFLSTILPSDCLNKGDLIAFFMARGMEIPRDLAFNEVKEENQPESNFEKTRRFKRGYKLPDKEIYKEHELRFRVDKKLKLLGVGFGFLFSNTDMGITVHCQGPWETRQWSDIIETYCRVTWEKMKTADVRLMFSEAVTIEPNQCYKILVRISRMSAGAGSVDLWGGSQGTPSLKTENAEFSFLKAAVHPNKDVGDEDKDNTPGMVTDLFYQLWDGSDVVTASMVNGIDHQRRSISKELTPPKPLSVHRSQKKPETPMPKKLPTDKIEAFLSSPTTEDRSSTTTSPTPKYNTGYVRRLSAAKFESSAEPSWVKRKLEAAASSYSRPTPYISSSLSDRVPPFLRSRQPSSERTRHLWEIPTRIKKDTSSTTSTTEGRKTRENSVNKDSVQSKYGSASSSRYGSSIASRYGSGVSSTESPSKYGTSSRYGTTSRYGSGTLDSVGSRYGSSSASNSTPGSRYGSSSTNTHDLPTTSRYGTTSTNADSSSKYGSTKRAESSEPNSKYGSSASTSRYGLSGTNTRDVPTTSRYGTTSSNADSSSKYGSTKGTESSEPSSKYGSSASNSRYGLSSRLGNDYSSSTSSPTSRYGSSRYSSRTEDAASTPKPTQNGLDSPSSKNLDSSTSSSRSYRPYTPTLSNSRYGSGAISASSPTTKTRDPTPTRTTPSLGTSRYGTTTSSLGSSYSSRFGSSYYRR